MALPEKSANSESTGRKKSSNSNSTARKKRKQWKPCKKKAQTVRAVQEKKLDFQTQYVTKNIDKQTTPAIGYNIFFKLPDFIIFKTHMSKKLFPNYAPIKRYLVCATGSLPLKF